MARIDTGDVKLGFWVAAGFFLFALIATLLVRLFGGLAGAVKK